jgi:hypothetical protein
VKAEMSEKKEAIGDAAIQLDDSACNNDEPVDCTDEVLVAAD